MAGLTPFLFSSNMLQQQTLQGTSSDLTSLITKGLLSETTQTISSWYEMWINPSSITINDRYIQNRQHTAGSIVTFHYRQDVKILSVAGAVGWVQIVSPAQNSEIGEFNIFKGDTSGIKRGLRDKYGTYQTDGVTDVSKLKAQLNTWNPSNSQGIRLKSGRHGNINNNSPRLFLQRLKDLADQPSYYYDIYGQEHYNVKYIKMYTKQFPTGAIAEGYFTTFQVPETSDDSQTVHYNFEFIIENLRQITSTQRLAGMYSTSRNASNSSTRLV